MKKFRKAICILTLVALLGVCVTGCKDKAAEENTIGTTAPTEPTQASAPEVTVPVVKEPIDLSTTGGIVVVGTIGYDEKGWFLAPEQPLNMEYHYFLDNPSRFSEMTRISMFDSSIDGVDKAAYLGKTVTIKGKLNFYRNDFETLYLFPYTIYIGKTVEQSYSAPDLQPPDLTESKYDPSKPLPKYMDSMVRDGKYVYNAFMLSLESLELMGNDFATFYCDFVDAFLNYKAECPCPDETFAEQLSTIIYFEFPLYDVCAKSFEFVKHYNRETKTVTIAYKYDEATHQQKVSAFMDAADALLADTSPKLSDKENAKNIYHALSTKVTYDHSALTEFERKNAYYAYLHGTGVCVTFANVYNQLLTQVGIQATTAQCEYTATMGHIWSLITIDGKQYFCDPTFELNVEKGAGYVYFGQTYAQRTADGLGADGITGGRYYPYPVDASMISATPLIP